MWIFASSPRLSLLAFFHCAMGNRRFERVPRFTRSFHLAKVLFSQPCRCATVVPDAQMFLRSRGLLILRQVVKDAAGKAPAGAEGRRKTTRAHKVVRRAWRGLHHIRMLLKKPLPRRQVLLMRRFRTFTYVATCSPKLLGRWVEADAQVPNLAFGMPALCRSETDTHQAGEFLCDSRGSEDSRALAFRQ